MSGAGVATSGATTAGTSALAAFQPRPYRHAVVAVAAAAVLLGAADTYVIVLALPAIMTDVGISLDRLQEATPIITGFLLGYVIVMPLLGRLSDVYGRRRLFLLCLMVFAAGSLITASAHDLTAVVAGRALQGLGGGGLVPLTLALVADLWPVERRGVPLGAVGAVQELGSVIGPLYGAAILTISTWRTIFWINLPLCALLALGFVLAMSRARTSSRGVARPRSAHVTDFDAPRARRRHSSGAAEAPAAWRTPGRMVGGALASIALIAGALAIVAPQPLVDSVTAGVLYAPLLGVSWLTPLSAIAIAAAVALLAWESVIPRSSPAFGRWAAIARRADWLGALLVGAVLAAVVVSFASTDPAVQVISPNAAWLLPVALACAVLFVMHERRSQDPLIHLAALREPAAYGALLTNFALGAALMTALLDIPILARTTVFPDSQLGAALVLLRMLVAVPVGALAGGVLSQRLGNRVVAGAGMLLAAAAFALMTQWSATTLADPLGVGWLHPSDPVLVLCGFGFGLAIAPVNASILAGVRETMHGLASSLVVVARIVGMLVGISVLTAVGLRAFHVVTASLRPAAAVCPTTPLNCAAYNASVSAAIIDELRVVFLGAAVCAAAASLFAFTLLRGRPAAAINARG